MNALSSLWQKLNRSKRYRESFHAAVVKRMVPLQIRILRRQRSWSQAQLAQESKLTQGVISRAEDPDYGNLTINTLVRIAAGFDCAFISRFVPFSELGKWYTSTTDDKGLEVPSFGEDRGFTTTLQAPAGASAEELSQWPVNLPNANQVLDPEGRERFLKHLCSNIKELEESLRDQTPVEASLVDIGRARIAFEVYDKTHYPFLSHTTAAMQPYTPPIFADTRQERTR